MPSSEFTAVLIGATGLVGSQLLRQLLADARCTAVVVLGRRSTGVEHPKLREHVIDFERPEAWKDLVRGDVLFSALGTTRKAAGSTDAQYRVDYTYQRWAADAAAGNGVSTYVLVSSAGANPGSAMAYPRMKGELERDVKTLGFRHTVIVQPGLLAGERTERRRGEEMAYAVVKRLPSWRMLDAVRAYPAEVVARACIRAAVEAEPGVRVYTLGEVLRRGGA